MRRTPHPTLAKAKGYFDLTNELSLSTKQEPKSDLQSTITNSDKDRNAVT